MRRTGAVLGFGQVAEHGHWPAWRARGDVSLVAIADPDATRRARAAALMTGVRTYADATALLASEAVDFVDIAAPPADHMALATAAARAGCHVLCEKPLATSTGEYVAGLAAAKHAGVRMVPVHNWRHAPQCARVMGLLRAHAIGVLRHVRIDVIRTGPSAAAPWRRQIARAGGGILADHGWHAFYLLQRFCGERPSHVRAHITSPDIPAPDLGCTVGEDGAQCEIGFPSSTANVHLTWTGAERHTRWRLTGEEGTIVVEDDWLELTRGRRRDRVLFAESLSASSHHPQWFAPVIDEFFDDLEHGGMRPAKGTAGQGLAEAEVCLLLTRLAYASAESGGSPLPVPPSLTAAAPEEHP